MDLKKLLAFLFALGLSEWLFVRAEDDDDAKKADADDGDDDDLDAEDSGDKATGTEAEQVVALTDSTFKGFIKDNQYVVVEFYAPWCGHCKALTPHYEAAAKELKKRNRKTKLAKVDATTETAIGNEYGVQGYPTLFYFADGVKSDYGGGRTTETIISWVEAREREVLEECDDEKVKKLTDAGTREEGDQDFVVVAKVIKKSGKFSAIKKAMSKLLAEEKIDPYIACVQYLPKGTDEKKEVSLTLHKMTGLPKGAENVVKFSKAYSQGNVYTFLTESALRPVSAYKDSTWKGVEKKLLLVTEDGKTFEDGDKKKVFDLLKQIDSKKYSGFEFGWDDQTQSKHLGDSSTKEGLKIVITADGKKYWKSVTEFKKAEVESYLKDFVAGKLKASYKSAELTETHAKNVRILVGSNFEEIALSPKKDVLVKFYAPWCGHCKALIPTWDELADKVKDMGLSDKVVIAKFDATENECELPIDGYPKLIFFPAVKNSIKKKLEFQGGERTAEKFIEFLGEHAKAMEGMDLPGEKIDKKSFSIIDRERAKKKKAEL